MKYISTVGVLFCFIFQTAFFANPVFASTLSASLFKDKKGQDVIHTQMQVEVTYLSDGKVKVSSGCIDAYNAGVIELNTGLHNEIIFAHNIISLRGAKSAQTKSLKSVNGFVEGIALGVAAGAVVGVTVGIAAAITGTTYDKCPIDGGQNVDDPSDCVGGAKDIGIIAGVAVGIPAMIILGLWGIKKQENKKHPSYQLFNRLKVGLKSQREFHFSSSFNF